MVYVFLLNTSKQLIAYASEKLVSADATYVSLSFSNPELKKIELWAGISQGQEVDVYTFSNVGIYWSVDGF